MAKQRQAIGLDIGAQTVKMAYLERVGNSVKILDCKIAEKPVSIKEMLKDISSEVPVVASIEGSNVFIRVFKLPGVAKNKLGKIIAYEAQQQVPFPIDEVVWSYQCLRRVSPEETDVVLVAARAGVVKDLIGALGIEAVDVTPPLIGLNNLLAWNRYEDITDTSGQAVMVLDLGAKTTNLIIIEKDNLWFRTIPIGGEVITQAIGTEYALDYTNAELLKREKGEIILEGEEDADPDRRRMSTCIIKSLTRLASEISRSMEVYSTNFNSLGARRIFTTGGGAGLKNIGEFFSKKFRCDVSGLNIEKGFGTARRDTARFGPALGLGLQGLGLGRIRLSLLPKEQLTKYKWQSRKPYVTAAAGLIIFLGICLSGYNLQMTRIYNAGKNRLSNEMKALDLNKTKLKEIQEDLDKVRHRMDIINGVKTSRSFWLEMILNLEGLLPANTWLTAIDPIEKTMIIAIRGKTAGTYDDIMRFRDSLNNSGFFAQDSAQVISANPPVDGVRDFVIEVKLNV